MHYFLPWITPLTPFTLDLYLIKQKCAYIHMYIYMLDTYWRNELIRRKHDNEKDAMIRTHAWRKTQEGRRRKTSLTKILPLTLLQGFERVVQWLHVRGSWRPNINCNILTPLLWPSRCVFLVLLMLGSTPSGFLRAPSVVCGFPYHIWSLAVWNSTGNCFLDSDSTELNNNSTPTRSPTGSLKSNV